MEHAEAAEAAGEARAEAETAEANAPALQGKKRRNWPSADNGRTKRTKWTKKKAEKEKEVAKRDDEWYEPLAPPSKYRPLLPHQRFDGAARKRWFKTMTAAQVAAVGAEAAAAGLTYHFALSTGHSGTTTISAAESYEQLGFDTSNCEASLAPPTVHGVLLRPSVRPSVCLSVCLSVRLSPSLKLIIRSLSLSRRLLRLRDARARHP